MKGEVHREIIKGEGCGVEMKGGRPVPREIIKGGKLWARDEGRRYVEGGGR